MANQFETVLFYLKLKSYVLLIFREYNLTSEKLSRKRVVLESAFELFPLLPQHLTHLILLLSAAFPSLLSDIEEQY